MRTDSPGTCDDLTVGRIARHIARTNPSKVALDDGFTRLTYTELDAQVDAAAGALQQLGVGKGDVVGAYLPNRIEYVVLVLATARAGGIFSPLNPRFRSGELAPILTQAKPRVVATDPDRIETLHEALAGAGQSCRIVCCDGANADALPWDALTASSARPEADVGETDFFSLMFTSGTTGVPKGALATHRARMLWVLNACILYSLGEDDAYVGTMPLVHSAGLTFTLMHLYVGGTVHILREFSPEGYIELVEKRGITSSLVVPTMLVMILEAARKQGHDADMGSLRRLVTCGSPLQQSTREQVLERITERLYDYYGSTESNSMTVLKPADQLRKPGSVGQPFANVQIRILGEDGNQLPAGDSGEVCCRNPSLMTRYLGSQALTASAFAGGWFHTGDLGYLDEEGFLYLIGRKGDMIISGGMNIYPAEIETALMSHPDILDCAVVGEPHGTWGQCVAAYVVPRDGRQIELKSLQAHCATTLADYKKPRILKLVSSIPKNAGGKTIKSMLAEAS